jgi:hypothetical protein
VIIAQFSLWRLWKKKLLVQLKENFANKKKLRNETTDSDESKSEGEKAEDDH